MRASLIRSTLIGAALLLAPAEAQAHPHEWIDVASEVLFDERGRITAIRHHWRFDEGFSAFALQGLDADGDGAYSPQELEPLARENVESLGDFDFFTFLSTGDYQAGFAAPKDYHLDLDEGRLTLHFTLPLAQPLFSKSKMLLQVYDPEYYIAFSLPSREAVRLVRAPESCRLDVFPAQTPDAAAAAALAEIGPEQRELPAELQELASGIENSAEILCGDGAVVTAGAGAELGSAESAAEAAAQLAGSGSAASSGGLSALPAEPLAAARPQQARQPGFFARLGALQTAFNRQLTGALKGLKTDGSAFWWLGAISFLYGIVHAAGPGHGKVVISSYLLANEQRVRRGIAVAFLSALLQAAVAVALVGILAAALNMTSMAITGAAGFLESASFALVAALGVYLLLNKGRRAWAIFEGSDAHAKHGCASAMRFGPARLARADHHHHRERRHPHDLTPREPSPSPSPQGGGESRAAGCTCGGHHADPATLAKPGLSGALAAVLSVGLRPCTGALVVLAFALAQGIFWAGIASTLLMAFGTAIAVAALAALAVGAKDVAARLTQGDGRRSGQVMLALEIAAALFIAVFGATLFVGTLAV